MLLLLNSVYSAWFHRAFFQYSVEDVGLVVVAAADADFEMIDDEDALVVVVVVVVLGPDLVEPAEDSV